MSLKDDPLQQHHTPGGRTLFLNRDNMLEARENWWRAFREMRAADPHTVTSGEGGDRITWDIAFAAAVAAFSYIQEGKVGPR